MLNRLIFVSMLLVSISSCKSKDAFNYSENFVTKERSLSVEITATEDKVKRYFSAEQFDSITIAGEKMEQLVETKIQEIKKEPVPDVKEGKNFKEACIRYFSFIKSMYTGYKELGRATDEAGRNKIVDKLVTITNNKNAAIDAVKTAQKKFAEANGFRLE